MALLVLAACGGWAMSPFRRAERPYLALATPLAGLATLSAALDVLHRRFGLTIPRALLLAACANALLTLGVMVRRGLRRPTDPSLTLLAGAAICGWGALACNSATIRAGEPTVMATLGSDTYGYAMVGDWLLTHPPGVQPAYDTQRPFEALPRFFWYEDDSRAAAFEVTAAAAWARGTSALFSCDWLFGVGLSSAVLALGGALARDRRALLLLLAAGVTSGWLVTARTGYLAKTLCYPGTLLLAVVYVELALQPTLARCCAGAVLGLGVAGLLTPLVPSGLLASACLGLLCSLALRTRGRPSWPELLSPVGGWLLLCSPAWLARLFAPGRLYTPTYPLPMTRALEASLDIDHIVLQHLDPLLAWWLLAGVLSLTAGLAIASLGRARSPGLLACAGLLPVALVTGSSSIYAFHGLLYPFSMGGAMLLLEELRGRPRARKLVLAAAALSILARLPHASGFFRYAALDYASREPELPVRASEAERLRRVVGSRSVDFASADPYFACLVQTELALRGLDVRCTPSTWRMAVGHLPVVAPERFPKSDLSIVHPDQWVPPERVLHRGPHAVVVADHDAMTIRSVTGSQYFQHGRWYVDVSQSPARLELWNGTGELARTWLILEGPPGGLELEMVGDADPVTSRVAGPDPARISLSLLPGFTWIRLAGRSDVPAEPRSLLVSGLRLESER